MYTNICAHIRHQYDIGVQRSVKDSSLFTRIWTTLTSYICLGVYKRSATPHRRYKRLARCPTKPNADYFGTLEARPNICLSAPHLLIHGPINFTHQENVRIRNQKILHKVALEIHNRPISAFALCTLHSSGMPRWKPCSKGTKGWIWQAVAKWILDLSMLTSRCSYLGILEAGLSIGQYHRFPRSIKCWEKNNSLQLFVDAAEGPDGSADRDENNEHDDDDNDERWIG